MKQKLLAASLLLSLGVMLLGGCGNQAQPPAPAPEKITPEKIAPEKIAPEKIAPEKIAPEEDSPAYGLPLEITIEGVPEVPEEIRGPSAPIEEKEELAKDRRSSMPGG